MRILDQLVLELVSHAIVEEEVLYSTLDTIAEARAKLRDARREHHEMEELLHDILSIAYSEPRWLDTFRRLKELIDHHVREEEAEVFRIAQAHLSKDELRELDRRFQEQKEEQRHQLAGGAFALPR